MSLNSVGLELNAMCTVWKAGHHWVLSFRWDLLTDKMHCIRCQQPSAPPFSNISNICYFSSFFSLSLFLCLHTLTDSFSIYPEREFEKLLELSLSLWLLMYLSFCEEGRHCFTEHVNRRVTGERWLMAQPGNKQKFGKNGIGYLTL